MKKLGLLLISFTIFPGFLSAQTLNSLSAGSAIIIVPQVPTANQEVRVAIESSTVNLDTSTITWTINGSVQASGRGLKSTTFTTGNVGSRHTIIAAVSSAAGNFSVSKTIDIGSVDLLWHGTGHSHPFYKGKTPWARQTRINFLAIANSANPSGLIYKWSLDGEVAGSSSGVGKNTFSIGDSVLGLPRTVSVEVVTASGSITARNSVTLSPVSAELLVYELHPLYGYLFNREASGQYRMRDEEVTLSAFPMFFSTSRDDSNINYEWKAGSARDTGSRVTYRTEGEKVSTPVNVRASHAENFLQTVNKAFVLSFDPDEQ